MRKTTIKTPRFLAVGSRGEWSPRHPSPMKDLPIKQHLCLYLCQLLNTLVTPTPDNSIQRGVFSIRSPNRPNPLGLCTTELIECKGNILTVRGIDAIDGTPLVDIKPYVPEVDEVSRVDKKG